MHLGTGIPKTPDVMTVAPPSPDRARMFSLCFSEAVSDYDILMDIVIDTDGVTLPNACTDEMDMIGVGHILDAVPHGPHSGFDLFRVSMIDIDDVTFYDSCTDKMDMIGTGHILDAAPHGPRTTLDMFEAFMLEIDDDDSVAVVTPDVITVEGAFDYVDPSFSFDTMSTFVTHFDDVAGGNNNVMSVFEYSPVSLNFPLIVSPTPTTYTHDVDDVRGPDDPLSDQSDLDSDSEERKVTPISGSIELVDFGTPDQPKELKIGTFLSPEERSRLIDLLRSYLDVFAWSYEDMLGLDPSIVQHRLPIMTHARPVKQKLRRLHPRWSL